LFKNLMLAERFQRAYEDPKLLELRSEIALLEVRMSQLREALDENPTGPAWTEIIELFENRRKLVESERKRLVEMGQMVTVEQVNGILGAVLNSVLGNVSDKKALGAISADVARLISGAASNAAQ